MKKLIFNIYYYFLFKVKDPKKVTLHPRYDKHIKYGFSVGDKHYYRLAHDYDIFEERFKYLSTYYQEVDNKMTSSTINEFCDAAMKYINDGKHIQAGQLLDEMKYRSTWLFEPTSLYKYASVLYFDLQEDIIDYDVDYNHSKIEYWSKKKTLLRLLLKELMENVDGLLSLSKEDFNNYLSNLQEKKDKQQKLVLESGLESSKKSIEVTT
tara:strand:- start:158 stop:784 length:627 start_codon:yes stop_codon:yes gene_type:complete